MQGWDDKQYLKFERERTLPCRELAARIDVSPCRRIVDLGCGPANSTAVLRERWPDAEIVGIDTSPDMLAAARRAMPATSFVQQDIAQWVASADVASFDLVFSNAAWQWVPSHLPLMSKCVRQLRPGAAFAFQVPFNPEGVGQRLIGEAHAEFADRFTSTPARWAVESIESYYDALAPHATDVDVRVVSYQHVMPSSAAIVEWYVGTALRPFLSALPNEDDRVAFLSSLRERFRAAYPSRADGRVLFPFERLFVIATK
jgi:trans-aconitate 2-methyltransferase